jgi:hypothetical protein
MVTRLNVPDLAFAAFLVALGALAFALAGELSIGSAAAMGPGYVPRGLALIILACARRFPVASHFPKLRGGRCC